jgi:hypothetical protein
MTQDAADRLAWLKALRLKIRAAIDGSAGTAGTASYSISDSDGSQSLTRRSPKELMDMLDRVEAEISEIERELSGGGIRTFGTRLRL